MLKQDSAIEIYSWENLYTHHEFLVKPLLENWEKSSVEKEHLFSLTFYALLRSQSALKCSLGPEDNIAAFEKKVQVKTIGLTKIEVENSPYFKCLLNEWKEQAEGLIFKSCKYYFTH